jgi:hypothetical protein
VYDNKKTWNISISVLQTGDGKSALLREKKRDDTVLADMLHTEQSAVCTERDRFRGPAEKQGYPSVWA